jgi:hypothetical protein
MAGLSHHAAQLKNLFFSKEKQNLRRTGIDAGLSSFSPSLRLKAASPTLPRQRETADLLYK